MLAHDAFVLFDHDRNGLLDLNELYGAFEWLRLPALDDVVFFVRTLSSREPHLSYRDFMSLILNASAAEDDPAIMGGDPAVVGGGPAVMERETRMADGMIIAAMEDGAAAPFAPKEGDALLQSLLAANKADALMMHSAEAAEKERFSQAQAALLEAQTSTDFSWLRTVRGTKLDQSPHINLITAFFDFTSTSPGAQNWPEWWMETEGQVVACRAGSSRVPCIKLVAASIPVGNDCRGQCGCGPDDCNECCYSWSDPMIVFKSPFRKNGGGRHLNSYTLTWMFKMADTERFLTLLSLHGFAGAVKREVSDHSETLTAHARPSLNGEYQSVDLGHDETTHIDFGDDEPPSCKPGDWHVVTHVVDVPSHEVKLFLDGQLVAKADKDSLRSVYDAHTGATTERKFRLNLDGGASLASRFAFPAHDNNECFPELYDNVEVARELGSIWMRSMSVHNRVLTREQVQAESAMLHGLLLDDAIAQLPACLQPELERQRGEGIVKDIRSLLKSTEALKSASKTREQCSPPP